MIIPSKVTEPALPKKAKNMSSRGSRAARSGSPRLGIAQLRCASQVIRKLRLEGIPEALQNKFGVGPYEEVTFVHLDHGRYRDGIKFRNGAEVTLQQLEPGIAAVVIMSLERTTRKFRVASVAEAI